jgi:hypothetical protein
LPPPGTEPQDLVSLLRSGEAPREIKLFAARGLLPLDRDERMRALLAVAADPDAEVLETARATLLETPPDELAHFLSNSDPTGVEIDTITRHSEDPFVVERVIRHKNVADETLEALARTVTGAPQEALIVNQVRLLRMPALIDALFENPGLTTDGRRRLNEVREEFFEKEERREAERERVEEEARQAAEAEVLAAAAEGEEAAAEEAAGEVADESINLGAAYRRIAVMTVGEKIDLAYKGSKDERRILIGDTNKLVGLAVLKSRGVTLGEIEFFCSMRQLDDEIFRKIAANREWLRKPSVVLALAKNPGAPLSVTLPLIKRLPLRELRSLTRDPNLPEAIRITARKFLEEKRK